MQRSQHIDSVAQAEGKAATIAAGDGAHPAVEVGQPLIDKYVVGLMVLVTLKVARLVHVEEKQRLWQSGGERQRLVVMTPHVALV